MKIAFFGSSLVSDFWNGAAAYHRGIVRALAGRGHQVTFYEPDVYDRQAHRDIPDPDWARVEVYSAEGTTGVARALSEAGRADLIVKSSSVGVFDELLETAVLDLQRTHNQVVFWDVDAPATLDRVLGDGRDPFRELIPAYDAIFTYGGGPPVVRAYRELGARACHPIYNALDPDVHHPVAAEARFEGILGLMANRLPEREERVQSFFLAVAEELPEEQFVLGGSGWDAASLPRNVRYVGHVHRRDHNAFDCTPRAVLNINRESMARYGYSPPPRIFEAAGAGACIITNAWPGLGLFLEPGLEVLDAGSGVEVADHLRRLSCGHARAIGEAARRRVLAEHTYDRRAEEVEMILRGAARPRLNATA